MELRSRALLTACLVALVTVLLARLWMPAAALWTACWTLAALGSAGPGALAALPVFLAALPPEMPRAAQPPPGPVRVEGLITAISHDPLRGQRSLRLATTGGLMWLRIPQEIDPLPGDRLKATARCAAATVPGLGSSLWAAADACHIDPGQPSLLRGCAAARQALQNQLLELVPGKTGVLLCTLVLGNETRLQADTADAHRATGLSHLLAVSGAHAAMLAWLLGLQPFGGGPRRPIGRRHLLTGMGLLFLYGAITGLDPPMFRALCSYALVGLGVRTGRRVSALQGLAWPALLSCIIAPHEVLGPSFSLSYAAVIGLALAGGPRTDNRFERWLWLPMRASFWAMATTAPLTLFWFGQLAPWTVLLTPVLAPLVGILLFLGLGTAILGLVLPAAAKLTAIPLAGLADGYSTLVETADILPGTPIGATVTASSILLAGALVAGCLLLIFRPRRSSVLLTCTLACAPHFIPSVTSGPPTLHLLAVGHGQACLAILEDGSNVLIDCGSLRHPTLTVRKLEEALRRRCIDVLVLSHGDHDHIAAVPQLLRRVRIRQVVLPTALLAHPIAQQLAKHGCSITALEPGMTANPHPELQVRAPMSTSRSANNDSLWCRLELGGTRVLTCGDAEEAGVDAALRDGLVCPAEVLIMPHHGRPNSRADALLEAVQPSICLVSNRAGQEPSPLAALARNRGITAFTTGVDGDLELCGGVEPVLRQPTHGPRAVGR